MVYKITQHTGNEDIVYTNNTVYNSKGEVIGIRWIDERHFHCDTGEYGFDSQWADPNTVSAHGTRIAKPDHYPINFVYSELYKKFIEVDDYTWLTFLGNAWYDLQKQIKRLEKFQSYIDGVRKAYSAGAGN